MKKNILMGVMNVTPNSFSDGDEYKDQQLSLSKIKSFLKFDSSILDLGAESTAPFNGPISFTEEWTRLDSFISSNIEEVKKFTCVSIDTYKTQTILAFLDKYHSVFDSILWNDVSGDYEGALEVLQRFPNISYVLSHNLSPKRSLVCDHMNYLSEDILSSIISFFNDGKEFFEINQIESDRIYLDPCFGFSKTKEQNYLLLKKFSSYKHLSNKWLIGVSRKSFLQSLSSEELKESKISDSEFFHVVILSDLMKMNSNEMIFRIHDPRVFKKALDSQIFKIDS